MSYSGIILNSNEGLSSQKPPTLVDTSFVIRKMGTRWQLVGITWINTLEDLSAVTWHLLVIIASVKFHIPSWDISNWMTILLYGATKQWLELCGINLIHHLHSQSSKYLKTAFMNLITAFCGLFIFNFKNRILQTIKMSVISLPLDFLCKCCLTFKWCWL